MAAGDEANLEEARLVLEATEEDATGVMVLSTRIAFL